jgi:4-hydroxybenzoate polyprenyltransferase
VWAYDVKLKDTPAGPAAMAAARGLDVLLGGGAGAGRAAASIAAHTYGVTVLSRGEVAGCGPGRGIAALAATGVAVALAAPRRRPAAASGALLAAYAVRVGRAQLRAVRDPAPDTVRAAVGTAIIGLVTLQAALLAGRDRPLAAAALAAAHPVARLLTRKVAAT